MVKKIVMSSMIFALSWPYMVGKGCNDIVTPFRILTFFGVEFPKMR